MERRRKQCQCASGGTGKSKEYVSDELTTHLIRGRLKKMATAKEITKEKQIHFIDPRPQGSRHGRTHLQKPGETNNKKKKKKKKRWREHRQHS